MLTTDIMRLKFWILRKSDNLQCETADSLICSSKTWFQFDDEVVTKIDFLGEKRYTGKGVEDVLKDAVADKKCVSFPGYSLNFLMFLALGVLSTPAPVPRRSKGSKIVTMKSPCT